MPLTPQEVRAMRFTPVRLREGYDMGEVDEFLDEVETELERLLAENDDLRSKLAAATGSAPPAAREEKAPEQAEKAEKAEKAQQPEPEKPAEVEEPVEERKPERVQTPPPSEQIKVTTAAEASSAATRLLELATRNADELVAEARTEAEQILVAARTDAEQLENETRARTEQLDAEARNRAQQLDADTEARRREALSDIEREKGRLDNEVESLRSFEREYRTRLKTYFTEQLASLDGQGEGGTLPVASEG
jgi:DivIVA domain-containing protein